MNDSNRIKISPCFHYAFEPRPPTTGDKFPKTIDLEDEDIFTLESFKEQFLKAQNNGLPYYLLAIAELKPEKVGDAKVYKIYSASSLRIHRYTCLNKNKSFTCPLTTLPIQKIYYIAIDCFKLSKKNKSSPCSFSAYKIDQVTSGKFFYPDFFEPSQDEELALDALNQHIDKNGSPEEYIDQKEKQQLISCILTNKYNTLQKALYSPTRRKRINKQHLKKKIQHLKIEAAKWNHCSSLKPNLPPNS